jgi:aryl-alcohol dehydrogenase-like predicted oxidoreductase
VARGATVPGRAAEGETPLPSGMRYRQLGRSGLTVSVVGLGANNFGGRLDLEGSRPVVEAALDAGINLIDTSDSYGNMGGSEEILGSILEKHRDSVVLATKFGSDMGGSNGRDWGARASRRYVTRAVESSLRRLRTDWIDLYQLHRPDGLTPLAETLEALDDLVHQGKVRYVGSSNLASWQVVEADWLSETKAVTRFVSAQNHYSLLERQIERELVPACVARGIAVIPYFPLANGLLTGKWAQGEPPPGGSRLADGWARGKATDEAFKVIEALRSFADEAGVDLLSVAIGGLAAKPAVGSVIAGATSAEQVRANAQAGDWEPTAEELGRIDQITAAFR